jgi:parallel beta-helix repeat protein
MRNLKTFFSFCFFLFSFSSFAITTVGSGAPYVVNTTGGNLPDPTGYIVQMGGRLVIEEDITFNTNAAIVVQTGGFLELKGNVHLTSNTIWNGITIDGWFGLAPNSWNDYAFNMKGNAKISNCTSGLFLNATVSPFGTGGFIREFFINGNLEIVNFTNFGIFMGNSSVLENHSLIPEGSQVLIKDGPTGLYTRKVDHYFTFHNIVFQNTSTGVLNRDSRLELFTSKFLSCQTGYFNDINTSYNSTYSIVKASHFENCFTGVRSNESTSLFLLHGNTMANSLPAHEGFFVGNLSANFDLIGNTTFGVSSLAYLRGCTNSRIYGNEFNGNYVPNTLASDIGVIDLESSKNVRCEHNKLLNSFIGISVEGSADSRIYRNDFSGFFQHHIYIGSIGTNYNSHSTKICANNFIETIGTPLISSINITNGTGLQDQGTSTSGVDNSFNLPAATIRVNNTLGNSLIFYNSPIFIAEVVPNDVASINTDHQYTSTSPLCRTWKVQQPITEVKALEVYPNPFNDIIQINKEFERINLFSVEGKLLKCLKQNDELNLSWLNQGIYILEVISKNGTREFTKIQKQ